MLSRVDPGSIYQFWSEKWHKFKQRNDPKEIKSIRERRNLVFEAKKKLFEG